MHEVSGLLLRLNLETRRLHAAVDGPWLDLLRPAVSVSDYLAQLVRTYGVVAPFESACRYTPGLARVLDFRQLTRAGLIAQDLLALELTPSQVANIRTCPTIEMFRTTAEALGWIYMIDRTTLLADGIRRHLMRYLPQARLACAYLGAFEGHVGHHWAAFGQLLDRVGADTTAADEIVRAAHEGFDTARMWFRTASIDARRAG